MHECRREVAETEPTQGKAKVKVKENSLGLASTYPRKVAPGGRIGRCNRYS
jgi:hypothetical protein